MIMLETIFWCVLIAFFVLGALTTVGQIGKPRKPTDHSTAVVVVVVNAALVAGVIYFGLVH